MSRVVARVGELAEQLRGVTYAKEEASTTPRPGYLPLLRANNITDNGLVFDDLVFVPSSRVSDKQRIRVNDIVIAASSGSLDVVGKAAPALVPFDGTFGAFCKVLRPTESVHPGYLAHFLKTPDYRRRVSALAAGANINNLRNEHLDDLEIPLPSLAEQRRIATILDKADALRAKRRAALAQLDTLTQSIFLEMFGDPVANDRGWQSVTVADFVSGFGSGKNIVAGDEGETTSRYRVLKVSSVTSLHFKPEESKPAPPDYTPPDSHLVQTGDLLFSRANTSELIGAVAYVHRAPANLLLPDKIWRFRWYSPNRAEIFFVWHLFLQPKLRTEIGKRGTGTSGSMKNVSMDKVMSIRLGLPPFELQRVFARQVSAIETFKAREQDSLGNLDSLFASLQHRAFRGDL